MKSKKTLMILSFVVLLLVGSILVYVSLPKKAPEDNPEDLIVADELGYEIIDTALRSMITDPATDPLLNATPEERFSLIDFDNRFLMPMWHPKATLYVASLPQKPVTPANNRLQTKPLVIDPSTSVYNQTAFIDSSTDPVRWFSIVKDSSISPAKYQWQLSLSPFDGSSTDPLNPKGLLSDGEVSASSSEFSIDFSKALTVKKIATRFSISESKLKAFYLVAPAQLGAVPVQKTYYVRILPLDDQGKVLGDPGTGISITYGDPITLPMSNILIGLNTRFDLLTPRNQGAPYGNGEFPNLFNEEYTKYIDPSQSDPYYCFVPQNFPTSATSLVLQVTKTPFSGSLWNTVAGLVYQQRINKGEEAFDQLDDHHWLEIDFSKFAPSYAELGNDNYVTYFVRTVALTPTNKPGVMSAKVSKTVTIQYGKNTTVPVIYDTVKVDPLIPEVVSFSYVPIQWETQNWQYHYVVTRQPKEKEIFLGFGSDQLYGPFAVGTKLDFTPKPNDDSWWDDVKNAISNFFGDLTGYLAKITNWVSETYADLKSGLITFVADHLPGLSKEWRDKLKVLMEGLVDYGLMSIGIPPTLPNFDDLTTMGADYLATMAMESAGVPASDLITEGVGELKDGIIDEMKASANRGTPNPMNWNFVKLDPDYLFRPAYFLITIRNPYNVPTPEGTLSAYNEHIINTKDMNPSEDQLYARFGGNVYYSTFKTVTGMKIPSLAPGQTLVIPIFLEDMIGKSYWTNGPIVDEGEFGMIYNNLKDYTFNVTITYDLPNAYETAKIKNPNAPKEAIYSYSSNGTSLGFTGYPSNPYTWTK